MARKARAPRRPYEVSDWASLAPDQEIDVYGTDGKIRHDRVVVKYSDPKGNHVIYRGKDWPPEQIVSATKRNTSRIDLWY